MKLFHCGKLSEFQLTWPSANWDGMHQNVMEIAINYSRKLLENSFISKAILELIDGDGNLA